MGDIDEQVYLDAAAVYARMVATRRSHEAEVRRRSAADPAFRAAAASAYRAGQAATPDGPRRWALADDATALDEWGVRIGYVILITPSRQVAVDTAEDRGGELLRRRVIRSAWEPADATPAADGQDGDGRGD